MKYLIISTCLNQSPEVEHQVRRALKYFLVLIAVMGLATFFMPLRLAISMAGLEESKFSAKDISGTIWDGRIDGAKIGDFALGDLGAAVQFFPLLTGRIKLDLQRPADSKDQNLTATIGKQGRDLFVENATATLNIGPQLAPLPASNIELDRVNVSFTDGRCQSASGKVRLSLDANIPGLDLRRGLLGNAKCENDVLVLPLKSGSGMEQLTMKLQGNGAYTARLLLSGDEGMWALLLPTLGFQKVPSGYAIRIAGQLGR